MIPVGLWAGWSIFGPARRLGLRAALRAQPVPDRTTASETRMYSLLSLFGLTTTTLIVLVFVLRRRRWAIPCALSLAAMLYTHGWGLFYGHRLLRRRARPLPRAGRRTAGRCSSTGSSPSAAPRCSSAVAADAARAVRPHGRAVATAPRLGAPIQISRGLMGGDRRPRCRCSSGGGFGLAQVLRSKENVHAPDRRAVTTIVIIIVVTLVVAWIARSSRRPGPRATSASSSGRCCSSAALGLVQRAPLGHRRAGDHRVLLDHPDAVHGRLKSDVRDIAAEIGPQMHAGDIVVSGQPEQMPTLAYYFGPDKRYAHTVVGKCTTRPVRHGLARRGGRL